MPGGDEDVESDAWVEPDESVEEAETPPALPPRPTSNADRPLSERIATVSTYTNHSFWLSSLKGKHRTMWSLCFRRKKHDLPRSLYDDFTFRLNAYIWRLYPPMSIWRSDSFTLRHGRTEARVYSTAQSVAFIPARS